MIEIRCTSRAATAADVDDALAAIDQRPGAWLGCDVDAPGLFRRQARAALDPLLAFYLDGAVLRVVPQGGQGQALAGRLPALAEGAEVMAVDGRLDLRWPASACRADAVHPVVTLLRALLAQFAAPPPAFGLYGTLAFDYHRLSRGDDLPDDGRRRLVLFLPRRVLVTGEGADRLLDFELAGLPAAADAPPAVVPAARPERRDDDHPPGGHAQAVARGVERMARGELCSLVLSQTFRRPVPPIDAAAAFARLRRDNPYPAMFFVHTGGGERIFGASPDIQVRADDQWVETAPVCGTFRRGRDAVDDYWQAKGLMTSDVDEASLAVCADSDRADKARVCVPGSVEQVSRRRLHFFSTIIHAIDHTRGRRRADRDAFDIVLAHATPATVTGMPKAVARRVIADIESGWRGWYAGAAVRLGADGSCEALTMLRFARLLDGIAEVRTGGSLLADSDPVREEEETRLKAETLFRVLAGQSPKAAAPPAAPLQPHGVRFDDGGDPLGPLLAETLVQAGCRLDAAAPLQVLGDGADVAAAGPGPLLAVNGAGLALLARDGMAAEPLPQPQFARRLACRAEPGGPLAALGEFDLGLYTMHWLPAEALAAGWHCAARGEDGRVVAAIHPQRRAAVLLARPDSVLSQRHGAGPRAVAALLDWLAASVA